MFLQLGCRVHQSRGRNFAEIGQRDEPFEPQFLGLAHKSRIENGSVDFFESEGGKPESAVSHIQNGCSLPNCFPKMFTLFGFGAKRVIHRPLGYIWGVETAV